MVFSYAVTYGIAMCAGWKVSCWFLAVLALCYEAIKQAKKRIGLKKGIEIVAGLSVIGILVVWEEGRFYLKEMVSYFRQWKLSGEINLFYGWILLLLIVMAGELVYRKIQSGIGIKLIVAVVLTGVLCWQAIEGKEWEVLPVAAILYLLLESVTEAEQYFVQKRKGIRSRDMLPFLLGVILLVSILPTREEPISWKPVKQFFSNIGQEMEQVLYGLAHGDGGKEFSVNMMGFSDKDENFWGKLLDEKSKEMMRISVHAPYSKENKYFVGAIKDTYENNTWKKSTKEQHQELSEYEWQLLEHLYYLYRSGVGYNEEESFCRKNVYSIQYTSLNTNTIFYPVGCYQLFAPNNETISNGDNVEIQRKLEKGEAYYAYGIQMNLANEELVTYLREASGRNVQEKEKQSEESGKTLFDECARVLYLEEEEIEQITGDSWTKKLKKREKEIEKTDTQLPEELPERVKDLADHITKDCENDYDRVTAIVSWLKNSGEYTYTLEPEGIPENRDVVDWFLFEGKKGYCTYFASAATVLCRCEGIPARYVEGVSTDYEDRDEDSYLVKNQEAHAWTQVYLKGFGWIDVDATPGYEMGSTNWEKVEYAQEFDGIEQKGLADAEQAEKPDQVIKINGKKAGTYVVLGIVAAGSLCLIIFLINRIIVAQEYRKGSNRKKANILMKKIMHCLKKRGLKMEDGQTLRIYAEYLRKCGEIELSELMLWYETVCYSPKEVTNYEISQLKDIYQREKKRKNKKSLEKSG